MRLIDDEKVVHEYYKNPSYHQLCKVLNEAEEVIAIPIDWIHNYLNNTFLPESHFWVIQKMIKEWAKEHEKDI